MLCMTSICAPCRSQSASVRAIVCAVFCLLRISLTYWSHSLCSSCACWNSMCRPMSRSPARFAARLLMPLNFENVCLTVYGSGVRLIKAVASSLAAALRCRTLFSIFAFQFEALSPDLPASLLIVSAALSNGYACWYRNLPCSTGRAGCVSFLLFPFNHSVFLPISTYHNVYEK